MKIVLLSLKVGLTLSLTVLLATLAASCALSDPAAEVAAPTVSLRPLTQSEIENAASTSDDWQWVHLGGCLNPSNAPGTPGDKELKRQYADFHGYMKKYGIDIVSAGSLGISFNVRSDQLIKAKKLINAAMKDAPNRWSRLTLETD